MKNGISKFGLVLLAASSGLAFASCNKGPSKPSQVTYKFYSMTIPPTTYYIGDEYYGHILEADDDVMVVKSKGTFVDTVTTYMAGIVVTEVYEGTWVHKEGIIYEFTMTTRNGEPMESPESAEYTIQNNVLRTVDPEYGFATEWHKA